MNDKKICFITCVNDDRQYEECLVYINNLNIPEGYEIDAISIKEAKSITSAYNEAMKNTDAKYKVYLHQDTYIINKNFIADMLKIFNADENIGMLGVAGAKIIPTNGIWWESSYKYGQVYESHTGKMELLAFNEVKNDYEEVKAIDGLIMITQYDLPWREDVFDGWHFYDVSQSVEFSLAGYKVAVPKQKWIWCTHDCGLVNTQNGYDVYRNRFLDEYSRDIFPLVSVLIPTYNRPEYFQLALKSVLNQTYKNIEIIIGDDSTNDETEELVTKNYLDKYDNIKYYHNEKNLGQFDNDIKLYNMATGQFINYLMDDDLFEVIKIEKMMNYFIQDTDNEISLITSHRGIIDSKGSLSGIFGNTDKIFNKDCIMDGIELGNYLIINKINFIGEPTTVLFRKKDLLEPFGVFNNRKYGPNIDQASWLNLMSVGKVVYINEILSYFRIHEGQQQRNYNLIIEGYIDHAHKLLTCRDKNFLKDNREYLKVIKSLLIQFDELLRELKNNKNSINYSMYKEVNKYYNLLKNKKEKISNETKETCEILEIDKNEVLERVYNDNDKIVNKLPLVSILIPAYNQTIYLKEALESAINQTYPNIEIIVGDDSTTDEVENFIKPYLDRYNNISYFKNKRDKMDYGMSNSENLLKVSNGEYINYLYHDDVFALTKIEKMMNYFLENPNITMVTSVRQQIDENGNELPLNGAFQRLFDKDTLISGYKMNRYMITNIINCIGEPTTVLFKKKYIDKNKFGYFNKILFTCNVDVATWATLLQYGDMMYISEVLSYFRCHSEQNSNKPELLLRAIIDWYNLINESYKLGIIINNNEYKIMLHKWIKTLIPNLINLMNTHAFTELELRQIEDVYHRSISEIFENKNSNKVCPICKNKLERFLPYQYKEHVSDYTYKYNIIGSDTENFSCPYCYCHDRERHIIKYFDKLNIWNKYIIDKNVLHIAPENYIQKIICNLNIKEYICGDLYPSNSSIIKMDITDIQFEDGYFDFIICNHVLEHIPDDLKAMKELYRVLKEEGCAVLQTPYSPVIDNSTEDNTINTDELRRKYFGQSDHVRVYGKDLFKRIETAGFRLKIVRSDELFTNEEAQQYGFNNREDLILAFKK